MKAYVVLFEVDPKSIISRAIGRITESKYTHAGVLLGRTFYDASESRGSVGSDHRLEDYGDRKVSIYSLEEGDDYVKGWVDGQLGREYDYLNVILWYFHIGSKHNVYCFEWVIEFTGILKGGLTPSKYPNNTTALDIIAQLPYTSKKIYEGKAKDFKP